MATETEAKRLRRKVGYDPDDITSLPQEEADDLFSEAAEKYENEESQLVRAAIIYLEGVLANAAKLTTYRQNQTQENVSDLFGHVKELIAYHREDLTDIELAYGNEYGGVRFGRPKQIPSRMKEYPNS